MNSVASTHWRDSPCILALTMYRVRTEEKAELGSSNCQRRAATKAILAETTPITGPGEPSIHWKIVGRGLDGIRQDKRAKFDTSVASRKFSCISTMSTPTSSPTPIHNGESPNVQVGEDTHQWIPMQPGDSRSPCPALNTLANHGYL